MAKTPVGQKLRKTLNTPKTLPKKMSGGQNDTPKPSSVGRARKTALGFDADASSVVTSICTPGRTTRSMARVISSDMPPPPMTSRATPSKRRTMATPKSSGKQPLAPVVPELKEDVNDEFIRPLPPKSKQLNQSKTESTVDDSADAMPMADNLNVSRKSARGKKAAKAARKSATVTPTDSSEDDLPSVSMLEMKHTPGKYVRASKSAVDENEDSTEDDLPSVSMLVTEKPVNKSIRSRKSLASKPAIESDEGLPSVSLLGNSLITFAEQNEETTQSRRSKRSINKTEVNQEEETAEKSVGSRKSIAKDEGLIEPKDEKNSSVRRSVKLTPKGKRISSRKSSRKTPQNADFVETENKAEAEADIEMNEEKPTNGTLEEKSENDAKVESFVVPSIVVSQSDTAKTDETEEYVSAEDEVHDLPKPIKKQSIGKKNRVSVIDLTDSPMPSNNRSVLNKTFTPVKETDEKDINNETFTEDTGNKSTVNDKTFSPLPNQSTAKKSAMKHVLLPPPAYSPMPLKLTRKSIGKKKSPQLKRLQGTPLGKPNSKNNLNHSSKLSSAKKTKMAEAAADLVKQTKPASSPKVFKFGEENKNVLFRFSLVSESLRSNNQPQKGKAVIVKPVIKPAPNFGDMHNKMFKKAESIDETQKRHEQRAHLLLSGKKPTAAQRKADKSLVENVRKIKTDNKTREEVETRRPLAHVNRARMNDEERRRQLFKQGPKPAAKKNSVVGIKGVRLNRRFELMMQNRSTSKRN